MFHRWELLQGSLLAGGVAAGPLVASPVRSTLEHMTNNLKLFRSITLKPLHISSSPLGVQLCLGYSLASSLWPLASGLNLVCRLGVSSIPLKIYVDVLKSFSPYQRPQACLPLTALSQPTACQPWLVPWPALSSLGSRKRRRELCRSDDCSSLLFPLKKQYSAQKYPNISSSTGSSSTLSTLVEHLRKRGPASQPTSQPT